jgi:hypothetical protein
MRGHDPAVPGDVEHEGGGFGHTQTLPMRKGGLYR